MEIPGGGGSNMKPSGMENPVGWGVKLEKTLRGGYGYFLEPHNKIEIIARYVRVEGHLYGQIMILPQFIACNLAI